MKALQNLTNLVSIGRTNLGSGAIQYLLKDTFSTPLAAGSVNNTQADIGGARTVTDTNSKISITGGVLSFATGEAANDLIKYTSRTRVAGEMFFVDVVSPDNSSANLTIGGGLTDAFRLNGGVNGLTILAGGVANLVGAIAVSTSYKLLVVERIPGAFFFIKGGTFTNWTLVWVGASGSGAFLPQVTSVSTTVVATVDNVRIPANRWLPTPLAYDTFTRSNGALGSTETTGPDSQGVPALVWTGSTWTISTNAVINTPNLGSELVTNGTFDVNTTGWTANGATLASVAGGQSGNALQVTNSGAAAGYAFQSFTTVIGQWYYINGYYKNGTGGLGGSIKVGTAQNGSQNYSKAVASASLTSRASAFRATATTTFLTLINTSAVSADTTIFDEVTIKPVTDAEMFSSITTSTKDVIVDVNVQGTGVQAGLVLNLDSASTPRNFVVAYIEQVGSATATLLKGVWDGSNIIYTQVIAAAVTFSAGATLRVIKDGTNYQLFYNNAKVGSTSTISDAAIISNTLHGLWAPNIGSTLDNFLVFPRGVDNNYAALDSY